MKIKQSIKHEASSIDEFHAELWMNVVEFLITIIQSIGMNSKLHKFNQALKIIYRND